MRFPSEFSDPKCSWGIQFRSLKRCEGTKSQEGFDRRFESAVMGCMMR